MTAAKYGKYIMAKIKSSYKSCIFNVNVYENHLLMFRQCFSSLVIYDALNWKHKLNGEAREGFT